MISLDVFEFKQRSTTKRARRKPQGGTRGEPGREEGPGEVFRRGSGGAVVAKAENDAPVNYKLKKTLINFEGGQKLENWGVNVDLARCFFI